MWQLQQLLRWPGFLWCALFGFHVIDSVKRVPLDALLLHPSRRGWQCTWRAAPLTLGGQGVHLAGLLAPSRLSFVAPWWPLPRHLRVRASVVRRAHLVAMRLRSIVALGWAQLAVLFVLAPALTWAVSLGWALAVCLPLAYGCVVALWIVERRVVGGSIARRAAPRWKRFVDLAVCPAHALAWASRLAEATDLRAHGLAFALTALPRDEALALALKVRRAVLEQADDPAEATALLRPLEDRIFELHHA